MQYKVPCAPCCRTCVCSVSLVIATLIIQFSTRSRHILSAHVSPTHTARPVQARIPKICLVEIRNPAHLKAKHFVVSRCCLPCGQQQLVRVTSLVAARAQGCML
jgi:hypothetical protein